MNRSVYGQGLEPWSILLVAVSVSTQVQNHLRGAYCMKNLILRLKVWKDTRAQDLIEYALMAGFVAVAAGAIMPGVATSISIIFSQVASVMSNAATQGS